MKRKKVTRHRFMKVNFKIHRLEDIYKHYVFSISFGGRLIVGPELYIPRTKAEAIYDAKSYIQTILED